VSACISREGEFGEHVPGDTRFVCGRCFSYDEDGALKALEAAESRARDMEIERNMLRTTLAETLAMLEDLDAAWGGTGEVCS
jgi:hypothetical protein